MTARLPAFCYLYLPQGDTSGVFAFLELLNKKIGKKYK
jgi:hypothetical protein